jgi:hypothetical protein
MSEHDFAFERQGTAVVPCDNRVRSCCDACTAVHVSEGFFFFQILERLLKNQPVGPDLSKGPRFNDLWIV